MDIRSFRQLLTSAGQAALEDALALEPREKDFLPLYQQLCRKHPEHLARPALETAILRGEAQGKFPFANKLYFTRQALEQASSWPIAAYRAKRYAGFKHVLDLGCSIGCDTIALAQVAPVIGIDCDALRLVLAKQNLQAMGLNNLSGFIQADIKDPLPFSSPAKTTGIFFDPARRENHRRAFHVEDYQPPLSAVRSWLLLYPVLGVKISPGVKLDELQKYDCEVEFISLRGELKEAVLWFGVAKSAERRATLLPGEHSLTGFPEGLAAREQISTPLAYIYEPDPAILRAGLVQTLGWQLGAYQIDPDIAYLTSDQLVITPLAKAWQVEDWFPFQLKQLRAWLRQRRVGRAIVKKRGSPLSPEEVIRSLRLSGEAERVIFLTHVQGKPVVIVAHPQPSN